MAKAEASYNKVYTNTYLEGTAKTSLLNAKINLWGQRDTLLSAKMCIRDRFYPTTTTQIDFEVLELKLEKGNKATAWTPAPEDVQAEIDSAKQEALSAASDAQSTADSLKNFTDTAFRDGIIDRSESVAIEKYKNSLNEAMAKAEASYNKVYTNTYLSLIHI